MEKIDIKSIRLNSLKEDLGKIGFPSYRAFQIFDWIYKKGVSEFSQMDNLPGTLRERLDRAYYICNIMPKEHLKSYDGTEKVLFELLDRNLIETVLIRSFNRNTICLSTQVGCRFRCRFCASGEKGFVRNLSSSEIIDQILFFNHYLDRKIDNFVFMGMGEPLDNFGSLSKAILIMNSPSMLGIGARRITVSTCGIVPGIEKLNDISLQINLSISLHASNNTLRDVLVPVNRTYPIEKLIKACKFYLKDSNRKITLEYVVIKGENDSQEDIKGLSKIARTLKAKVNLIPYSPVPGKKYIEPTEKELDLCKSALENSKISVTIRESKGKDIYAACGQLAMRKL
ncbi:MAG: 23S rRNA (adenine(2503)-C(2))-methyltransferase RlmN [Candidatus Omnitrophota bacterium]